MLIGVIADDFTGASDIASALASGVEGKGGLSTVQFLGIPDGVAPTGIDAGVVSLKSRSIAAREAVRQSVAAADWLIKAGVEQIIFKYCSTFDSTPQGNIGPVAEALADRLGASKVIFCPSFPANGRTVYQGNLFVHDVPLAESGMAHHPLTPMRDSDIRRVLQSQAARRVGHLPYQVVQGGAQSIKKALAQMEAPFVVVDAISDCNLVQLAESQASAPLVTGGSAIAAGLAENFIRRGHARSGQFHGETIDGPEIVIAGSCSGATLGQIEYHRASHPEMAIDVDAVMSGEVDADTYLPFLLENAGNAPLLHSSAPQNVLERIQKHYGSSKVAARLDRLFGDIAAKAVAHGVRRVVVAGGETSGAVANALGFSSLRVGKQIDPGVPVLISTTEKPVALALKSGNFGAPDFFEKALNTMVTS
ncbi:four-carbon acid sugar kinase family protein [Acetobacter senegalensis]|uniref:3-oxo-tetronate kinase n=1 Tax=Acetobacter senegalensis TaxID=446692 RepID=UPI001EDAC963|nr:3-oxo-tetronate kinase [Acetobacter senegalensis]MCG4255138.1 four-carbon acid sugar kinase family protein [Acetobacter senegalensis]